jgi:transposase
MSEGDTSIPRGGHFTPTKFPGGSPVGADPTDDYPTAVRRTERPDFSASRERFPTPPYRQDSGSDTDPPSEEPEPPKNRGGRPRKKKRRLEKQPLATLFDKNEIPCAEKVGFMIGYVRGFRDAGGTLSVTDVEELMQVSRSAACRYMNAEPGAHSQAVRRKEAGNPEVQARMAQRQAAIKAISDKDHDLSMLQIAALLEKDYGITVCESTIFYDMHELGIGYRPKRTVPAVSDHAEWASRRLAFARANLRRNPNYLMFSDESIFRCTGRKQWEWRRWGEETSEQPKSKYSATCHVWGVIGSDGFNVLLDVNDVKCTGERGGMTAKDFVAMLEKGFLTKYERHIDRYRAEQMTLVLDGASIHKANPIENMWAMVKEPCIKRLSLITSRNGAAKKAMFQIICEEWQKVVASGHVQKLVDSWSHRMQTAIEKKGAYTGY